MPTEKELYAQDVMVTAQKIAKDVMDVAPSLIAQYFDNGYDGAGSDPILDAQLLNFNSLTAADIANVITALQQIENYFNNAAVTTADYAVTYNTVRNVRFTP